MELQVTASCLEITQRIDLEVYSDLEGKSMSRGTMNKIGGRL